ncbi:MAG: hypothetical protein A3K19_28215 [Lentisphaerae bacterium RIFOXYB12_FULL_65_16]|nr:MAG: hypothetical protein A3K18_17570 [Lentisphaerae bacterium RIFOXYA12_64_32]OGV85475.1 MAG: hypothetical protein A3K19_28215 [Lentisphaerae bacterium RIFOXYB12_FULL_65_16]
MGNTHDSTPDSGEQDVFHLRDLSNAEFLAQYAQPGRIGLASGLTVVDKAICLAERHLDAKGQWGQWSHAFVFEGERVDGHSWVIESDLQVEHKHIQLGAQENRVSKYYDEEFYSNLAILDLGLSQEQTNLVLRHGLDLVATHSRYSLRELLGAYAALRRRELRSRANALSRENSFFCSAFVVHLFRQAGIDLTPGVNEKASAPEDIFRSPVPHRTFLLVRHRVRSAAAKAVRQVHRRIRAGVRHTARRLKRARPDRD